VRYVDVVTAAELLAACEHAFPDADVLLMAAAVADFRPARAADTKLKKAGRDGLALDLEPTADVLEGLSTARRRGQMLVGFAAEHGDGALEHGREKLARKGLDAVVVNDIARADIGFEGAHNEVTIVTAVDEHHVPRAPKAEVARAILAVVTELRAGAPRPGEVRD
jgi:phosphopantothenoylcysteine decarboxylase/phosphopantothenate--cysteine ligase